MEEKNSYRMDVNKQVGRALADLRQHQGMTIEAAATATDTTPDKLADIERGYIPHNVHNLARIVEALGGRLAILPTDNPGLKHCEFIAGPPVKKPHPCHGCDHYRRTDSYCDFWKVDITDDFKCTNQKKQPFIVPQTKIYAK